MHASAYQISENMDNRRLSYRDLTFPISAPSDVLDLTVREFQPLRGLHGPVMHPTAKFQQNRTMHG